MVMAAFSKLGNINGTVDACAGGHGVFVRLLLKVKELLCLFE
jgi:hypothetical protein